MTDSAEEFAETRTITAVIRIIADDALQQRLRSGEASSALTELQLPLATRGPLLNLLNRVERISARSSQPQDAGPESQLARQDEIRKALLEPFGRIRWSFWTLLVMSVAVFAVGLGLLGVATVRFAHEDTATWGTVTMAGLGLADLVAIVYSKPWRDITRNLAISQRAMMVATSYPSAVALVQQGKLDELDRLERFTKDFVALVPIGGPA